MAGKIVRFFGKNLRALAGRIRANPAQPVVRTSG